MSPLDLFTSWLSIDGFTGFDQSVLPDLLPHPRGAREEACELTTQVSVSDDPIGAPKAGPTSALMAETPITPGISASMMLGYTLGQWGLPLDVPSIIQGFSRGMAEALPCCFTGRSNFDPEPTAADIISTLAGAQSSAGELCSSQYRLAARRNNLPVTGVTKLFSALWRLILRQNIWLVPRGKCFSNGPFWRPCRIAVYNRWQISKR
jgi:hypothetical protein